jgi:uncharacterized protein (DUF1778 family)
MGAKKRGGSDTAREKGLTGIVVHVSPEQRRQIGVAAARAGQTVKAFSTAAVLAAAEKSQKKEQNGID